MSAQTKVKVITEGADLLQASGQRSSFAVDYRWNDDASFYSSTDDILADVFTVVSYDRRSNSRSAGDQTTDMTVAQQARDAAAIIKAMGNDKSIIFGSSGGGIIGLVLAAAKSEVIDFLIVHEPPVIELLPAADAQKWRTFHYNIYMKNLREGWEAALVDFRPRS